MELSRAHTHIQQRKSEKDIRSLKLKFQAVIHRVSSGTWTQVLCESRKCPYPFNHCYSPILLNLLFPSSTWKLPISLNPPRSGYLSPFHFIYIWNHPLVFQVFFLSFLTKESYLTNCLMSKIFNIFRIFSSSFLPPLTVSRGYCSAYDRGIFLKYGVLCCEWETCPSIALSDVTTIIGKQFKLLVVTSKGLSFLMSVGHLKLFCFIFIYLLFIY